MPPAQGASARLTFELNGEERETSAGTTLGDLAAELKLDPCLLLVEHNGEAMPKGDWTARSITVGDRIEFVRIVAGG